MTTEQVVNNDTKPTSTDRQSLQKFKRPVFKPEPVFDSKADALQRGRTSMLWRIFHKPVITSQQRRGN